MRWGRVEVGAGFLLVVSLALYLDDQGIVVLALLACCLHELGHLAVLYLLGGQLGCLRLSGVGAEMAVQGQLSYLGEIWLALAGPLANLLAVAVGTGGEGYPLFCGINLALGALNLLPVAGLDGGRAVYALCCILLGEEEARGVSLWLSRGSALFLLGAGIWVIMTGGSFTLLLLAVWVVQKNWRFPKKRLARWTKT